MSVALLAFASRRVTLRPARAILLAASVLVLTVVAGSVLLFQQAIERTAERVAKAGPSLVVSRVDAGGWAPIDASEAARIQKVPGVRRAVPRVWGVLPGPPAVTLVGTPELEDGSSSAVVGAGAAKAAEGATLSLRGLDGTAVQLHIREVLPSQADLVAFDAVMVSPSSARKLLMLGEGQATDIAIDTTREQENDALAREIGAASAVPLRVVTRAQLVQAYGAQRGQRAGLLVAMLVPAALALALLVAGIVAAGDSARRDVGKLKLVGWSTGQIALLHWAEVGLPATMGATVGLATAYAQVFLLGGGQWLSLALGWGASAPALWLDTEGAVLAMIQVGALVLVPCTVAALLPAWWLARTDPIELVEAS